MFCLPIQISPTEFALYVFLQDENLERMREYDPAVVTMADLNISNAFHQLELREVVIGWASTQDFDRVMQLCAEGKPKEALRYLTRGFRYRPDQGDHDGPYLSLKPSKEKLQ